MGNWDIATPAGSDPKSQGDDRIRELKEALQEALRCQDSEGDESIFPGIDPSNAPVHRYRGLKGTTAQRPASGQYGLYFDTTRNVLQRDNGSTWDDIATVIPSGTVMCFFQAAVPTGWTQVVSQNDKVLRVVSATGGGSGGTSAISTGHSHTVNSHTHTGPSHTHSTPAHTHTLADGASVGILTVDGRDIIKSGGLLNANGSSGSSGSANKTQFTTDSGGSGTTGAEGTGATGAATPGTDTVILAYIDVVLGSKD